MGKNLRQSGRKLPIKLNGLLYSAPVETAVIVQPIEKNVYFWTVEPKTNGAVLALLHKVTTYTHRIPRHHPTRVWVVQEFKNPMGAGPSVKNRRDKLLWVL